MALAERPYLSKVGPANPTPQPFASPASFGAGVGQEVERFGGIMEQAARERRAIELQQEFRNQLADAARAGSALRLDAAREAQRLEENPQPGGAGHAKAVGDYYQKHGDEFLATLSPRVRERMQPVLDDDRLRAIERADAFEARSRADKWANDLDENITISGNLVRMNPTHEALLGEVAHNDEIIDAGPGTPEQKAKAKLAMRGALVADRLRALPPDQVATERDRYLEWLPSKTGDQLVENANVDLRRIANENARAATQQKELLNQQIATYLYRDTANALIDPAEGKQLADQLAALDPENPKILELRAKAGAASLVNPLVNALPGQITNTINQIEQTPDWQKNPTLTVARDRLIELRDKRRGDEPNIQLPDFNDGGSVQRWTDAVRADAKARGMERPTWIYGDLKQRFGKTMDRGPEGQAEMLALLNRMPEDVAFEMAQELAPSDPVFQAAATLKGGGRKLALEGRALAAEKADEKIVAPSDMQDEFDRVHAAMVGFRPEVEQATIQTAYSIALALHRQQGRTRYDDQLGAEAVRLALDGLDNKGRKTGGIGEVNGQPVLLPSNMTQEDFDRRYSTMTGPSRAFASGRQLTYEQVRDYYRLVAIGDGVYQWRDALNRVLTDQDNRPLRLHINKLAPAKERPRHEVPSLNEAAAAAAGY